MKCRHNGRPDGRTSLSTKRINWLILSPSLTRVIRCSRRAGRPAVGRGRGLRLGLRSLLSRPNLARPSLAGLDHIRLHFSVFEEEWRRQMPPTVLHFIDKGLLGLRGLFKDCRGRNQYPLSNRSNKSYGISAVTTSRNGLAGLQEGHLRILIQICLRILPNQRRNRVQSLLRRFLWILLLIPPLRMWAALQLNRV